MTQKERYRHLCAQEASIPIFSRDWWLDAVCGEENWDVAVVEKGGRVVGSMPFFMRRRFGATLLVQPPLTQTLGPWIRPSAAKYSKSLAYEKDAMEGLIAQLPRYGLFIQNWHHANTNWLPFYWKGFTQTTRYSYVLEDLSDTAKVWEEFEERARGDIRKASNRFGLQVRDDLGLDAFIALNRMTFARQGRNLPYTEELVRRIDAASAQRSCRKIWIAEDGEGRHHAGVYVVWDENSAYYLMGGGNPELRNSGATSLLMWSAIQHAAGVTKAFDFEGSMIEPVERFFRGFGARQVPYFALRRSDSFICRMSDCFRSVMRGR